MKTKNIYILIFVLFASINFLSCSEDFLNKEPNAYLSASQKNNLKEKNPEIVKAGVFGMYANMFIGGTGGTTDHDDFGQKSIDIATDMMAGDLALKKSSYGWFRDANQLTGYLATANATHKYWRYYYRLIKSANDVLDDFNDTIPTDNNTFAAYVAQAKIVRGYAYYNLLQIYAGNYSEWKDKKAIPYYKTQKTEATVGLFTPAEIMAMSIKDMEQAVKALEDVKYARTFKHEINANVAKGILAYCKLYVGDYQGAADLTAGLLALPIMSKADIIQSGFRSITIPAWMWGVDITVDNTGALMGFWGHMDFFTYSYAAAGDGKAIDQNLYLSIPTTDERRKWFHSSALINWYKFYAVDRKAMGDKQWLNDICFMRTEEMLLINAEANARLTTNDAVAKASLRKLVSLRDSTADATIDAMTNDQLLEAIHYNWRVEMWGEGKGLATLKRFKGTSQRGDNHYALKNTSIKYDDEKLVFQIPEREKVNNPNLH